MTNMEEMKSSDLSLQQRQSIEHLKELLVHSADLSQSQDAGVEWITSCLHQTESAVYLAHPCLVQNPQWIKWNTPDPWTDQMINPESRLLNLVEQVYTGQIPTGTDEPLQISAMLPIKNGKMVLGVFILGGTALDQDDLQYANALLDTFANLLISNLPSASHGIDEHQNSIIQSFAMSVSELTSNPDLAQFNLLQGIRSYFNAEYLLLIQSDQETPELLIEKLLGDSNEWIYQISQHLSIETLDRLIGLKSTDQVQIIALENESLKQVFDFPGLSLQSLVFAPILSRNQKRLGAMIVINPGSPMGLPELDALSQYAVLAAGTLENLGLIQKMKISLARLESREMELINSRNILREMFDNILISIYIINDSYTIQAVNKARSARTAVAPRQLVGKTCYEVFGGRNSPCPACKVCDTFAQGKNTSRSYRQWTASEAYIEWEISTHPIFDEMHTPVLAIIQEVDMTEKRNLEANLIQSEKLAAVGQLAAGVAHEINNPLSAIIANAQILLQEKPDEDPDRIESLKLIETAGIRASNVVRNLLSISHKENQTFVTTDINETIQGALLLIQHELLKHPIKVDTQLALNLPSILAQQDHLQGAWINLLMNAIDAIVATKRPDGILRIKTGLSGSNILITISDNGKGIEPEFLVKIFEPFYTTKSVGHGTGLGLSVCARTVKEHQGTISVVSNPGEGSHFTITLPVNRTNEDY